MKKTWMFLIGLTIIIGALLACGSSTDTNTNAGGTSSTSNTSSSTQATKAPAKPLAWTTTHKFDGNGTKQTDEFQVADTWKLKWTCDGGAYGAYLGVSTYVDGQLADLAVNANCDPNKTTSGETTLHKGGKVYISVSAGVHWTLTVQEQK